MSKNVILFVVCLFGVVGYFLYYRHDLFDYAQKKIQPDVTIQRVEENVHGNNDYCTDGTKNCIYNSEFFNDTWVTGKLDEDPTTHYDIDSDAPDLTKDSVVLVPNQEQP